MDIESKRISEICACIDSTDLRADATLKDIDFLCSKALELGVCAVCIMPYRVKLARQFLNGNKVLLCSVIGFPLGAQEIAVKCFEAEIALQNGANELDFVLNIGALKDGSWEYIVQEIERVLELKSKYEFTLKIIVETALLNEEELIKVISIVSESGADYLKTSTGMSSRGVSREDIVIINKYKSRGLKIKASGGIKTAAFAQELLDLGVDRIGTSNAIALIEEFKAKRP